MNPRNPILPAALVVTALASDLSANGWQRCGVFNARFGHSVAAIGDLDGDGCDDVLVGEPDFGNGSGRASVISGRTQADLWSYIGLSGSSAGWSVSSAGDIDGDGENEILIGCPDRVNGGLVVVLDPSAGVTRSHSLIDHRLGAAVSPLDDVNGDGYDDYLCASDTDQFGLLVGRVVCYDGKTGNVLYARYGAQTTGWFGRAICSMDDITGDGIRDFVVGGPGYTNGSPFGLNDAGQVKVYSGADGALIHTIKGITLANAYLGCSVASMGDYDQDGVPDLIAGAYGDTISDTGGAIFILSGKTGAVLRTETGANPGDGFGYSVAGTRDVNKNGGMDFVVGSPFAGNGKVQLFSGSAGSLYTANSSGDAGYSVAAPGDVNGDGGDDFVYGSPTAESNDGCVTAFQVCPPVNETYGQGHPGTSGTPSLTLNQWPIYGSSLNLHMSNSRGLNTFGLVLVGLSSMNAPTSKDGTLLVNFIYAQLFLVGPGGKDLSFTAPALGSACDAPVYLQSLIYDPGASRGIAFSPGLKMKFGNISGD